MFDLTFKTQKKVREAYLHEQSQVTITCNCSSYMPGLLKELNSTLPDLKFRLMSVTNKKCISLLKEGVTDTIKGFKGILDGEYDDLPENAFYMVGTIEDAVAKAEKMKENNK